LERLSKRAARPDASLPIKIGQLRRIATVAPSIAKTFIAMLGNSYDSQICSIAATLDVIGERWSLLIVRDIFIGLGRFDEIQADLGIARNVLHTRLTKLLEQGVLEKHPYQERPVRWEYRLTEKGLDLWPTVVSLMHWGDRHAAPDGPPVLLEHRGCGGAVDSHRICETCGARLSAVDVRARRGPGAHDDRRLGAAR
jgi:DNA-binding HxlR family transcriptional regulator